MSDSVKRHPIRGFLYGIVFGLGLALVAIGQKWAALGTWPPFILFLIGIVIGTLWSTFGPAKGPKGPRPDAADGPADPEPPPEVTAEHGSDDVDAVAPDELADATVGEAGDPPVDGENEMG